MYNPTNYQAPRQSKKEALLHKYGYYEKVCLDEVTMKPIITLRRNKRPDENLATYTMMVKEDDIIGNIGESFRDLCLRIGWLSINEDGKVVEKENS